MTGYLTRSFYGDCYAALKAVTNHAATINITAY